MRIDVHAHYTPPHYIARLKELGAFEEIPVFRVMKTQTLKPRTDEELRKRNDFSLRIADMDAAGVDVQIIGLGGGQPYFPTESKAVEATRLANDLYKEVMDLYPSRFSAFGALPLPHVDAAIEEVGRCLDSLGFVGIGLGCSADGVPLDDPRFAPLWEELDRRSAIVYLHPGVSIDGIVGGTDFHLAPDYVSPAEIAIAASRLVVTGTLDRYPNVSIILATLGGSLPFFGNRFDRGFQQEHADIYEQLGGFSKHLKRFYYDTSVIEEIEALRLAAERFGADRLLLGSDFGRDFVTEQAAVSYVQDAEFLTADEKSAILDGNAASLLGSRLGVTSAAV